MTMHDAKEKKTSNAMMQQRKTTNEQKKLLGANPQGVTNDTTNKGPRSRGPAEVRREGRVILRFISFHVYLLDIDNKRCLPRRNKTGRSESHTLIHIFSVTRANDKSSRYGSYSIPYPKHYSEHE